MASSIDAQIDRFLANEPRLDRIVNGDADTTVPIANGQSVPSLARAIRAITSFNPRGDWAGATNYAYKDLVRYNGDTYFVAVDHVSGVFATDLAAGRLEVYQGVTADDAYMQSRDKLRARAAFGNVQQLLMQEGPVIRPNQTFIRALMSGTVKIVVCGDSITAGSDYFYSNGWVQNFTTMLQEQIPWIKWDIVNLSIPGRNLYQLIDPNYKSPGNFVYAENLGGDASQFWPKGSPTAGKAWRDYIKDEAPDLIIIAHQENHTDLSLANAFETLNNYTDTWAKKPWYTIVSGFLPTNETLPPPYYDGFKNANTQRQSLADFWRSYCMRKGFGLIDVNGVFRMLRDGVRRNVVPLYTERNFRYWGDNTKWLIDGGTTGAPTDAGSAYTQYMQLNGSMIRRLGVYARDVDFNADFTRTTPDAIARVLSYRLTGANNLSGYSWQYDWATGFVQFYAGSTFVGQWDSTALSGDVTDNVNLRVRAFGNRHQIYVRGKLIAEVLDDSNMFGGEMLSGYGQGQGRITGPQWSWAVEEQTAPGYYTNEDIFGNYGATYLSDPDSLGGDAIHHMGRLGPYLVYLPAVQVWLEQLKQFMGRTIVLSTGKRTTALTAPAGGAITPIPEMNTVVTVAKDTWAKIDVTFAYTANDPLGQFHIMADGAQQDEYYLPAGGYNILCLSTSLLLGPGTHTLGARFFAGASDITSGGGGGGRHFTVTLTPA